MFGFLESKANDFWSYVAPEPTEEERFLVSISQGRLDEIRNFMQSRGYDVNQRNSKGNTCLHSATFAGQREVVNYFLEIGGDPNALGQRNNTCLHFAAAGGHMDLVKLFVSLGNSAISKNELGKTPYDVAQGFGIQQYLMPLMFSEEQRTGVAPVVMGATIDPTLKAQRLANLAPPPTSGANYVPYAQQQQQQQHGTATPPPFAGGGPPSAVPPRPASAPQPQDRNTFSQNSNQSDMMKPYHPGLGGNNHAGAPRVQTPPMTQQPQQQQQFSTSPPQQQYPTPPPQQQYPTPPPQQQYPTPPPQQAPTPPPASNSPGVFSQPGGSNSRPNTGNRRNIRPDGFITTVGNPELASQYGNNSTYRPISAGASPERHTTPPVYSKPSPNPFMKAGGRYVGYNASTNSGQAVQQQPSRQQAYNPAMPNQFGASNVTTFNPVVNMAPTMNNSPQRQETPNVTSSPTRTNPVQMPPSTVSPTPFANSNNSQFPPTTTTTSPVKKPEDSVGMQTSSAQHSNAMGNLNVQNASNDHIVHEQAEPAFSLGEPLGSPEAQSIQASHGAEDTVDSFQFNESNVTSNVPAAGATFGGDQASQNVPESEPPAFDFSNLTLAEDAHVSTQSEHQGYDTAQAEKQGYDMTQAEHQGYDMTQAEHQGYDTSQSEHQAYDATQAEYQGYDATQAENTSVQAEHSGYDQSQYYGHEEHGHYHSGENTQECIQSTHEVPGESESGYYGHYEDVPSEHTSFQNFGGEYQHGDYTSETQYEWNAAGVPSQEGSYGEEYSHSYGYNTEHVGEGSFEDNQQSVNDQDPSENMGYDHQQGGFTEYTEGHDYSNSYAQNNEYYAQYDEQNTMQHAEGSGEQTNEYSGGHHEVHSDTAYDWNDNTGENFESNMKEHANDLSNSDAVDSSHQWNSMNMHEQHDPHASSAFDWDAMPSANTTTESSVPDAPASHSNEASNDWDTMTGVSPMTAPSSSNTQPSHNNMVSTPPRVPRTDSKPGVSPASDGFVTQTTPVSIVERQATPTPVISSTPELEGPPPIDSDSEEEFI